MTVWASSYILQPDTPTKGSPFTTLPPAGNLGTKPPLLAKYDALTYATGAGGTIAGQGGSISIA